MTKLMNNIKNQPDELIKCLEYNLGEGKEALNNATTILKQADTIYITGIGSSWHAGMAVLSLFQKAGVPAHLVDASELLHFIQIPPNSVIIVLSRSGKSVEIVKLLDIAKGTNSKIIGITNTLDSPLTKNSEAVINLAAAFDHMVSITMYSALTLAGSLLATAYLDTLNSTLADYLRSALSDSKAHINEWIDQISGNPWFSENVPTYFLARGGSQASCYEARLLWEEAAKAPATALTTGVFRHGPQEVTTENLRVCMWIDSKILRNEDIALARDLRKSGVKLFLIGRDIALDGIDLAANLPSIPANWQFLIDIIPAQLGAEHLSHLRGEDCDEFKICPYVIENEGGLL